MLGRTFCVLLLALGMTVVLAAPGGAAPRPPRGRDSVTCSLSAGTTFTQPVLPDAGKEGRRRRPSPRYRFTTLMSA